MGRGHADGGIRSANYNHEVPGHSGVSGRAEAGSAGTSRRLGTLPRSGRGDSCLGWGRRAHGGPEGPIPAPVSMWLRTLVVGLLVWAGATLLIDGWLRRPRGLSLYKHLARLPAAVCGRRGAEVAEGQLMAERMGDGRAGSGRPPSWFGELAKRRTSRFGVVAALPSQLAASAAVGTEPTERDFVPSHARADRDRCVRPTPGTALVCSGKGAVDDVDGGV